MTLDGLSQPEIVERAARMLIERRDEENLEFLTAAVGELPEDPEVRILYATALLPFRPEETPWELATAIALDPRHPWRLARAATILYNLGEIDASRDYAAEASRLAPDDFEYAPELLNLAGKFAAADGDDARAESGLRSAVRAEPGREIFAMDLAKHLIAQGRMNDAIVVIERALATARPTEQLRALLAEILQQRTQHP